MTGALGFKARFSEALRLALISRLARELNAELTLAQLLQRVLHATAEALGTPYASLVALHGGELVTAYVMGGDPDRDPLPTMRAVLAGGLAGFVLHNRRTVIVNDITSNPLWLPLNNEPASPQAGAALAVPLIHAREVVGVMTVAHPLPHYFSADAVSLTTTIAELGAAALAGALRRSEALYAGEMFANLFDAVIVPVLLTDLQGAILSANRSACDFLGDVGQELLRKNIAQIHGGTSSWPEGEQLTQLALGRELRFRTVLRGLRGDDLPVQVHAKRIRSQTQDCIQWILHDLTPELEQDRLREDLTAMVYHDMRGPLGNIYSSVSALRRLLADHPNPHVSTLLEVAVRSEQRVRYMVEALLDVQRLEEGRKLLNRTNTAFGGLIQDAIEQVEPLAEEKRVRIRLVMAEDLPMLYIDSNLIERVIINLLDNAIKYSPDFGLVTLSTASTGREVLVHVKDTGPGIPPDALERIFDKFERVRGRNMPYGVGLGLAFCKLAVEAHGGRIWVRSNEKSGSTFTLALPIEPPATTELPLLGGDMSARASRE